MCFANPIMPLDPISQKVFDKAPKPLQTAINPIGMAVNRSERLRTALDPLEVTPGIGLRKKKELVQDDGDDSLGG